MITVTRSGFVLGEDAPKGTLLALDEKTGTLLSMASIDKQEERKLLDEHHKISKELENRYGWKCRGLSRGDNIDVILYYT